MALGAAVALAGLALLAASAFAGKGVVAVFGSGGSDAGQFATAGPTAVNLSTGDVYVVDTGNNRVEQFDANGTFIRTWGWGVATGAAALETCTSSCQPGQAGSGDGQLNGPSGIAIDQSDGSVYVADGGNSRVEKFDASGGYLSQFGAGGSGDGQFAQMQGLAVDPTDRSVYVADGGNNRVEKFDSTGAYVSQFGTAGSGDGQLSFPTRVTVDSTGLVYVLDSGNARVERYTSAGAFDTHFATSQITTPAEIAIGPGNDHLYVAQWAPDFSEQRVIELDNAGNLIDTHGVGSGATNASGLALNAGSQRIYLADGFNARVFIMDDLTPPTVTLGSVGNIQRNSADLSGTVNPNGAPDVSWHFEISSDDVNWSPTDGDQDAGSGTSDVPVNTTASGLIPNTTYYVRLVAHHTYNAPVISSETQFTTALPLPPDVTTEPANDLSTTHATLRGVLNPNQGPTTYSFEYGTTTSYGTTVPVGGAPDPNFFARTEPIELVQRINGLTPGVTYHYRMVASNAGGTTDGADQTFTTTTPPPSSTARAGIPGAGFLPDNRGWELVSPSDKNGSDVMADSGRTRAATDGNALQFSSLGGFADTHGSAIATEYMALRTGKPGTSGWVTHGITPPEQAMTFNATGQGMESLYDNIGPDLSTGIFRSYSPLTNDPDVSGVENLYLRTDLRNTGLGSYQLLTACPACNGTRLPTLPTVGAIPRFAGASNDWQHVIFESSYQLTADAPQNTFPCQLVGFGCLPRLYEWDHGTVRFVGVLPDGSAAVASQAGRGALLNFAYTHHTISQDGSRILFTDPTSGGIYLRIDHATTVQVDASENSNNPGSPSGGATFWDATPDLSQIIFTTGAQLTNDDTNGNVDIYRYDVNAPAGHHLTRLSSDQQPADGESDVLGVVGMSDDASYVYFIAPFQMVADAPLIGNDGLYVWHDGATRYIGELGAPTNETQFDLPLQRNFADDARVTPDGRHLLFMSWSGTGRLTGFDHGTCTGGGACHELYLYDALSQRLACVSCNPSGARATGSADDNALANTGGAQSTAHLSYALSDDGQHVFFSSEEALVPQDTNGKVDVYEYDVPTGTVHLLSSGTDPSDSFFLDATPTGSDAFFVTRQRLVGWDTDQNYDVYDARVNGGLPDPAPAPAPCSGDGCQTSSTGPPQASTPTSVDAHGRGNVVAHPKPKRKTLRCKRGFVRRRVRVHARKVLRCVRIHRRHHSTKRGAR